jgi:hypothetical protein
MRSKKQKPLPRGNGFVPKNQIDTILAFPYAGITRIRFKGFNLRLTRPPQSLSFCFLCQIKLKRKEGLRQALNMIFFYLFISNYDMFLSRLTTAGRLMSSGRDIPH